MPALAPLLRGSLRDHPLAPRFAEEVLRIHTRYAGEIVARNGLCPHLRDVETGFGRFVVVLDPEPIVEVAVEAVIAAETQVVHVVYPCSRPLPTEFEKFSGKLREGLKKAIPSPPVMATFHPELTGDPSSAYRVIGLFRRAPDPFVQLIPEGLHQGGTVLASPDFKPTLAALTAKEVDNAVGNFARLKGAALEPIFALMADIHRDRARSYAPFLKELGLPAMGLPSHLS